MKARDIISRQYRSEAEVALPSVEAEMALIDVLPRLLDSPRHLLEVKDNNQTLGLIDESSLLEGLGHAIAWRDDSSVITIECASADYSASRVAHAVEDSDAHLVDLWSVPADEGRIRVMLRVRREDPTPTVHSLERYGFEVIEVSESNNTEATVALERWLSLQTLLNV